MKKHHVLLLAAPWPILAFSKTTHAHPVVAAAHADGDIYGDVDLPASLDTSVFEAAIRSANAHGLHPLRIAIADMSQPSTAKRLYIFDVKERRVVLRTWVAHGQSSGDLLATNFSNRDNSHATSLGLYRVGAQIASPKHGPALLLEGLDKGKNDRASAREIIMHGAEYVSAAFIAMHRRLGRSWGCPAVSPAEMPRIIALLADGGLLYVHG